MVWNTIAHPRMMTPNVNPTPAPYPIKFADPHKMAYFDLIIDMGSDRSKPPVLVHGDHETIKNKILNHEMVIAAAIENKIQTGPNQSRVVVIMPVQIVPILYVHKDDEYTILVDENWVLTPDNTIKPAGERASSNITHDQF